MSVNAYMGEVKVPMKDIRDAKNIKAKVYPIVDKKGAQLMGKSGKPSTLAYHGVERRPQCASSSSIRWGSPSFTTKILVSSVLCWQDLVYY